MTVGLAGVVSGCGSSDSSPGTSTTTTTTYAYVLNNGNHTITQFTMGSDGTLTASGAAAINTGGPGPNGIYVDPAKANLYVSNAATNLAQFTIGTGGALASAGTPLTTGSTMWGITGDPAGKFFYAANSGSSFVFQYGITSGVLSAMTPASVASGTNPQSVIVDPTGSYLFAANTAGNTISAYTIGGTGGLTANGAAIATATTPTALAMDPAGKFVFAANNGGAGTISQYTVNTGAPIGRLTANSTASTAGDTATWVTIEPNGNYGYATAGTKIYQYSLGTNGILSPLTTASISNTVAGNFIAADPSGKFVYVANKLDNSINAYSIGTGGGLTLIANYPLGGGTGPVSIALVSFTQ